MISKYLPMHLLKTLVPPMALLTGLAYSAQAAPNIIFLLADDMGLKDIVAMRDSATDGPTIYETPALDLLASEGVSFVNARASGPKCVVARRAILTGKYDFRNGVNPAGQSGIAGSEITYGEAMQTAGYRTCYIGKYHLEDAAYPDTFIDNQGFDVSIAAGHYGAPNPSYFSPYNLPNLTDGPTGEYLTDRLTSEAEGFISDHLANHPTQPFFLTLAHYAVHTPLEAKADDIAYFEDKLAATDFSSHPSASIPYEDDWDIRPTARMSNLQDQVVYAAMMKSFDDSLANLRAHLVAEGIADNTIIVISSDHGGKATTWINDSTTKNADIPTSNYPYRLGKTNIHDGGLRIPLLVYWPNVTQAGAVSDALVHGADFYASFLEMGNAPSLPNQHIDSISFVDSLSSPTTSNRTESIHWFKDANQGTGNVSMGAYIKGNYKLLHYMWQRRSELYDISTDLGETTDISASNPTLLAQMERDLFSHRNQLRAKTAKPGQSGTNDELAMLTAIGVSLPTAPSNAPSNLQLTLTGTGDGQVQVDWVDNSNDEEYFVIERANQALGENPEEIGYVGANETTFTDVDALPNTSYKYRVYAGNLGGWSNAHSGTAITTTGVGAGSNAAPTFTADPINKSSALENVSYNASIATDAIDSDGDALSFSLVMGPTWLNVASDGTLTGTPTTSDIGDNTFIVKVSDGIDNSNATLNINVISSTGTITDNFVTVADTYAKESDPANNYGTVSDLQIRQDAGSFARIPYFKFDVGTIGNVISAKLYVHSNTEVDAINALSVADNSWTESGLTWNNRPATGSIVGTGQAIANDWFVIDVTGYVNSDGTYSIALEELGDSFHKIHSKESGFAAYLEVIHDGGNTSTVDTFNVNADAHAKEAKATTNYGNSSTLEIRKDASSFARIPYLKFDVSGVGTVTAAKLFVHSSTEVDQINALEVTDNSWTESGLTWSNRPATGQVIGNGQAAANSWVEIDITGYINSDGTYTIALEEQGDTFQRLNSKEGGYTAYLEITHE